MECDYDVDTSEQTTVNYSDCDRHKSLDELDEEQLALYTSRWVWARRIIIR